MKLQSIVALAATVAVFGAGGWWLAQSGAPHKHQLEKRMSAEGKTYYTCAMHPQVRQDEKGSCPICGMKLTQRTEAPAGGMAMAEGSKEPMYWYDPMRPDQHFDKPGKSPFMDMQLVPKYADDDGGGEGKGTVVQIDPRMAQNLGLRVAPALSGTFWQRVDAVGSVALDERRIVTVESRAAGWIERLEVRAEGDAVKKGQRLAALYSPELYAARQELKCRPASSVCACSAAARVPAARPACSRRPRDS
jgi:membrane fusion protein, copper/silver efflux system